MKKCTLCQSKMELVPLEIGFKRVHNNEKIIIDKETPTHQIEWLIACTNCTYAERYNKKVKQNDTMP